MTNKEAAKKLQLFMKEESIGTKDLEEAMAKAIAMLDPIDERIQKCLQDFDFEKVAEMMKTCDWKWARGYGQLETVTAEMLRARATELMQSALDSKTEEFCIGTGGLEVYRDKTREIRLMFVFEDVSSADVVLDEELFR